MASSNASAGAEAASPNPKSPSFSRLRHQGEREITMGCAGSTPTKGDAAEAGATKNIRKPKPWKHPQPITMSQLSKMREEFWDTAPHYGGQKAESEEALAKAIVESAGIIVSNADLTLCYDERGAKYELPKYVLSEPTNLIQDN
uniref:DC-UbP/UBTD2 N-terminal domain-containing protein n=1 Tax=Leersia perrieri TaxID=77586 RepID=A0A0D9XCQ3_9ORYZ